VLADRLKPLVDHLDGHDDAGSLSKQLQQFVAGTASSTRVV
jgi:hypothetical protein